MSERRLVRDERPFTQTRTVPGRLPEAIPHTRIDDLRASSRDSPGVSSYSNATKHRSDRSRAYRKALEGRRTAGAQSRDATAALVTLTANIGEQGEPDGLQVAIDLANDDLSAAIRLDPDPRALDLSAGTPCCRTSRAWTTSRSRRW
ncbi:MAG: hypothetical protein HYV63_10025 [Candidatus Schekmanbacteria bacterium]|nr:hypothetical protein [Candidatus Schekmanbacteria bacterium]